MACSFPKSQIGCSQFCKCEGDCEINGTLMVALKAMKNILMRKNMEVKMTQTIC